MNQLKKGLKPVVVLILQLALLIVPTLSYASQESTNPPKLKDISSIEQAAVPELSKEEIQQIRTELKNATFDEMYAKVQYAFSRRTEIYRLVIDIMLERKDEFNKLQKDKLVLLQAHRMTVDGQVTQSVDLATSKYPEIKDTQLKLKYSLLIVNFALIARKFNDALYYLNEAEQLLPLIDKSSPERTRFYNMAIYTYAELKQYELGLDYVRKLETTETISEVKLCHFHSQKVELMHRAKLLKSDSKEIVEGISVCAEQERLLLLNIIKFILADLYLIEGQPQQALEVLIEITPIVKSNDLKQSLERLYLKYAQIYFSVGDLELAKQNALKVVSIQKVGEASIDVADAYNLLHQISIQQNNIKLALDYYKNYTAQQKLNLNQDAEKLLAFQLAKFRITEKLSEIEALNNQNELLLLEQKLTKENEQNNQLIIMLLMVTVLFLVLWMYRSNQVQKQLKEIAQVDALTRIANRRYFTEVANKHLRLSLQNKTPLSLLLFDLDKFKSINDTYGHGIGDWVLIETAKVCKDSIRESDMIGRLGGEEFGILLPNCDREQAVSIAEKCRKALLAIDTEETEFKFRVSGSFGVSDVAESGYTLKDILHNCDEALYEAKHRGRNQVVEYPFEAIASEVN